MTARFMSQVLLWIVISTFMILTIDVILRNATAELTNKAQDIKILKCYENKNNSVTVSNALISVSTFSLVFIVLVILFIFVYCLKKTLTNCSTSNRRQESRQELGMPLASFRRPGMPIGLNINTNTRTTLANLANANNVNEM